MEKVIEIISSTQALGENNRAHILAKIREIIPIGKLGSQEMEPKPEEAEEKAKSKEEEHH